MSEPEPVVRQYQHAAQYEDRVSEFDDGEAAQVLHVDDVAGYAEGGEPEGEAVDGGEEGLQGDDGVYHAGEGLFGGDGVFFDDFGEVVEAAGYGEGEEEEAEGEA